MSQKAKPNGPSPKKTAAVPAIVFDPEDVSSIVDGWLKDMGVPQEELRPNAKFSLQGAKHQVPSGATPAAHFGLRPAGLGLGYDGGSSGVPQFNLMDPLQRKLARNLQLQQRAKQRKEEEEAAGGKAADSSDSEEEARPGSRPSSAHGKTRIKKVMPKGASLMFFNGARGSKKVKQHLAKHHQKHHNK